MSSEGRRLVIHIRLEPEVSFPWGFFGHAERSTAGSGHQYAINYINYIKKLYTIIDLSV